MIWWDGTLRCLTSLLVTAVILLLSKNAIPLSAQEIRTDFGPPPPFDGMYTVNSPLRGRPLMIWGGGGGKIENGFIFSAGMPFENYFFLGKAFLDLFFPGEGPLDFLRALPDH